MATRPEVVWRRLCIWWHAVVLGFRDWKRKYSTKVAYAIMDSTVPAPARALPPLHLHQTAADRLDWLCRLHAAWYEIHRLSDGVIVLVHMPDLSVHSSGVQPSVAVAVAGLYAKMGVAA